MGLANSIGKYLSPPMRYSSNPTKCNIPLSPVDVIYPRIFISLASTRIGSIFVSLDPAIVKFHRYMRFYRLTVHRGLDLANYKTRDVVISVSIAIFLSLYQLRYAVLILVEPNSRTAIAMGDFLAILGTARNGLFVGLWTSIVQAIMNRVIFLFYGTRNSLSILTDCERVSLHIHRCESMGQMNRKMIRLEQRLLILFEFCRFITEGVIWAFILFAAFMLSLTAMRLQSSYERFVCVIWSITLIPHTFATASGLLVGVMSTISGAFYTHYMLETLIECIDDYIALPTSVRADHPINGQVTERMVSLLRSVDATITRQSEVLGVLLSILFYFCVVTASSFTYVSLYLDQQIDWLKWVMWPMTVQAWLVMMLTPLPIAYVASKVERVYRKLCSLQARRSLPFQSKVDILRMISVTGNTRFPLAYRTADGIPFSLHSHALVIINIFLTIFLMIKLLET